MTVIQHDADIVEFGPQPPVAAVGQTAGDEMEGARASPLRRRRSAFPLHGLWAALPACPPPLRDASHVPDGPQSTRRMLQTPTLTMRSPASLRG